MKTKIKVLIMIMCVLLAVAGSISGVMAYMTSTSKDINTFSIGKVSLELDETKVNPDGTAVPNAARVTSNEYHLSPGGRYIKDPTVTVAAGSQPSYVRVILKIYNASAVQEIVNDPKNAMNSPLDLLGGLDENAWICNGFEEHKGNNTTSYEFRYKQPEAGVDTNGMKADKKLPAVFTELIIPEMLTAEELRMLNEGGFKLEVTAHAIQVTGFDDEDDAWEAFEKQVQ